MPLFVEVITNIKRKVFLNLYRQILNLRNITIVFVEPNIEKDVMLMYFVKLIMVCILKKYVNLYQLLMRNDVI